MSEKKEKENGGEKIFVKGMAEDFQKITKHIKPNIYKLRELQTG